MSAKTITKQQAIAELGLTEWMVDDFVKRGYPPLRIKPRFRTEINATRRPRYRFPRSLLERVAKHRNRTSDDLVPIGDVLKNPVVTKKRTYKFTKKTLYRWIESCIFLDRPLTHDRLGAWGTLHVSRSDLEMIARMLDNPCGWQLPGNTGIWLAKGIYRDEDALWFSPDHLEQLHEVSNSIWVHAARAGHPAFPLEENEGKPSTKEPQWPTRKNVHGGVMLVIHEKDVQKILDWRKVKTPMTAGTVVQGSWLSEELYRDAAGLWVTNRWIRESKGKSEIFARYWNQRGLLPEKRPGRPGMIPGGARRILVYSLDALNKLLQDGAVDPGEAASATSNAHSEPAPTSRAERGRPGRPDENSEVIDYALNLITEDSGTKPKEVYRLCKAQFPTHKLFQAKNPRNAFRSALYVRRKNLVSK